VQSARVAAGRGGLEPSRPIYREGFGMRDSAAYRSVLDGYLGLSSSAFMTRALSVRTLILSPMRKVPWTGRKSQGDGVTELAIHSFPIW
jgi:hypothetical protein